MANIFAVILGGGHGTRLWPLSRRNQPKQFLNITGNTSMLRLTISRLLNLLPMQQIFVVTIPEQESLVQQTLPEEIKIKVVYDQSIFISQSINQLKDNALQGGLLAFVILLLFLRNLRSAVVVTFGIPICILFTFIFMYFNKLSLNMMSLGGLALGVGMLVDNGIVVIENIYRHRQMDKSPQAASIGGIHRDPHGHGTDRDWRDLHRLPRAGDCSGHRGLLQTYPGRRAGRRDRPKGVVGANVPLRQLLGSGGCGGQRPGRNRRCLVGPAR